jgi:hypothetical protein
MLLQILGMILPGERSSWGRELSSSSNISKGLSMGSKNRICRAGQLRRGGLPQQRLLRR